MDYNHFAELAPSDGGDRLVQLVPLAADVSGATRPLFDWAATILAVADCSDRICCAGGEEFHSAWPKSFLIFKPWTPDSDRPTLVKLTLLWQIFFGSCVATFYGSKHAGGGWLSWVRIACLVLQLHIKT